MDNMCQKLLEFVISPLAARLDPILCCQQNGIQEAVESLHTCQSQSQTVMDVPSSMLNIRLRQQRNTLSLVECALQEILKHVDL